MKGGRRFSPVKASVFRRSILFCFHRKFKYDRNFGFRERSGRKTKMRLTTILIIITIIIIINCQYNCQ